MRTQEKERGNITSGAAGETKDTSWREPHSARCLCWRKNSLSFKRRIQKEPQSGVFCQILTRLKETCEINKLEIKMSPEDKRVLRAAPLISLWSFTAYCSFWKAGRDAKGSSVPAAVYIFFGHTPARYFSVYVGCLCPQTACAACCYIHDWISPLHHFVVMQQVSKHYGTIFRANLT